MTNELAKLLQAIERISTSHPRLSVSHIELFLSIAEGIPVHDVRKGRPQATTLRMIGDIAEEGLVKAPSRATLARHAIEREQVCPTLTDAGRNLLSAVSFLMNSKG